MDTTTDRQRQRIRDVEFLSLMAHDLRQPLSVVMGMGMLLERHWDEIPDSERRDHVALITRNAKWMRSLVDEIVTAGAIEPQDPLDQAPFSAAALVEETVHDLRPADADRLSLHLPDDLPMAWGDPVKQRQILQNLIDNAIKYSGADTPIEIGVARGDETLALTIADRGLGIPPEEAATIFDRYAQVEADPDSTPIEGSGLGLYVCKAMVTSQGGEIGVTSNTRGVGSVFTYTMPIAREAMPVAG